MATPTPTPTPRPQSAPAPRTAAVPPQAAKPAPKSKLGSVKRGQLRSALRHLFYGPEGVGKTSLAADAPNPIFLDIEGGSENVVTSRYPFNPGEPDEFKPRSYEQVVDAVDDFLANPDHGFASLVIDTVDALESMIHRYLCEQNKKKGIEDFGYGKGYKAAVEELRRFLVKLDTLRGRGMQIVLIGHSFVSTFKNPEGEDYDRYSLHVHKDFGGQLKEWCDVVGFIRFEGGASKITDDASRDKRARGWTTNRRLVQLAREAAWDAKCRLSLPSEIELAAESPWRPFAEAKEVAREATAESLTAEIRGEVDRITGGNRSVEFTTAAGRKTCFAEVEGLIASADTAALARILAGLKSTASLNPSQES